MPGDARGYSWLPFAKGHELNLRHGAHLPRVIAPIARAIASEIVDVAPWASRPAFTAEVESWAWAEARCRLLRAWVDEQGLLTEDGEPLPALAELHRAEATAANARTRLGLTPMAMAKLLATLASASGPAGDDSGLEALRAEGRRIIEARMPAALDQPDDGTDVGTDPSDHDQPDNDQEAEP